MNTQKLNELLAPYRDKTLSLGCEVKFGFSKITIVGETENSYGCIGKHVCQPIDEFRPLFKSIVNDLEIIGHPPTLNTLLMALGKYCVVDNDGHLWKADQLTMKKYVCTIPLNIPFDEAIKDENLASSLVALLEK